jgi:ankyrin repeat protein
MHRPKSMMLAMKALAAVLLTAGAAGAQNPPASDRADALAAAARKGDAATVTKLLDEGVDVNAKFRYGTTALSFAADHGQLEVVKVLIARGADVNVKDTFYGATPLTWAVTPALTRKADHAAIVGVLLKAGATGKEQAFIGSIAAGQIDTVKVILDVGGLSADTLADALDAAERAKRTDIVPLLTAAGAKPRPELKLDETQLAWYAGTYRNPSGSELVIAATAGRLTVGAGKTGFGPPQPITLAARSETTFVAVDNPGVRVTFTIEDGKVTTLVIGPASPANTFTKQ